MCPAESPSPGLAVTTKYKLLYFLNVFGGGAEMGRKWVRVRGLG